jgi:hypothetical protein
MAESLPAELENGVPASNTTTSGGATGESNQLAEQINNDEMQDEELEEEEEQDEEIYGQSFASLRPHNRKRGGHGDGTHEDAVGPLLSGRCTLSWETCSQALDEPQFRQGLQTVC